MILSAAIRVKNADSPSGLTVIPCWRYHTGYTVLRELCPTKGLFMGAEEGFIDSQGDFLNKVDAYQHALECGQIPSELKRLKAARHEEELLSNDLY